MTDLDSLPLHLNVNSTYQPQDFRQLTDVIFGEGVLTGFTASQRGAGANMSVDVAAGKAIVTGDTIALQGKYLAWEDSVKNVTVGAAPGANSRIDSLVLRIYDATATGSGANKAALEVVAGTAAASPVAPTTPVSAILLATIGPILTSTTSITNAMITDQRTYATLAYDVVDDANASRLGTDAATASALMRRDASGRAKVVAPSASTDIANKDYVDNTAGTSAATASALMRRDSSGRVSVANGDGSGHAVNRGQLDAIAAAGVAYTDSLAGFSEGTLTGASWSVRYHKVGVMVFVEGQTNASGTVTLPAGFRPPVEKYVPTIYAVNNITTTTITTGGVMSCPTTGWFFAFYKAA